MICQGLYWTHWALLTIYAALTLFLGAGFVMARLKTWPQPLRPHKRIRMMTEHPEWLTKQSMPGTLEHL